ncbi:MAG: EboA domain-containing protein [Proteobacteria bacterium]|nr:EboA domain-containing protein [Pseudomonadota bacterium]
MSDCFSDILWARIEGPARIWLEGAWPSADEASAIVRFRAAFAGAARRLRDCRLVAADVEAMTAAGVIGAGAWQIDNVARTALLLRALAVLPGVEHAAFVRQVYLRGDYREQAAVLHSLSFLPRPEQYLELAIDACRTNVLDVFEAIACENAYPAAWFPEANFNQMVLKAIFMAVLVGRIANLASRATPELKRMAVAFASERRAAGRAVPDDVDLIVNLDAA